MRKLMLMLLLVSNMSMAAAFRSEKSVICGDVDVVLQDLQSDKYSERPMWMGKDIQDGTEYILLVNTKTGSWTFVQLNEHIACVLGVGKGHTLVIQNLGEAT